MRHTLFLLRAEEQIDPVLLLLTKRFKIEVANRFVVFQEEVANLWAAKGDVAIIIQVADKYSDQDLLDALEQDLLFINRVPTERMNSHKYTAEWLTSKTAMVPMKANHNPFDLKNSIRPPGPGLVLPAETEGIKSLAEDIANTAQDFRAIGHQILIKVPGSERLSVLDLDAIIAFTDPNKKESIYWLGSTVLCALDADAYWFLGTSKILQTDGRNNPIRSDNDPCVITVGGADRLGHRSGYFYDIQQQPDKITLEMNKRIIPGLKSKPQGLTFCLLDLIPYKNSPAYMRMQAQGTFLLAPSRSELH